MKYLLLFRGESLPSLGELLGDLAELEVRVLRLQLSPLLEREEDVGGLPALLASLGLALLLLSLLLLLGLRLLRLGLLRGGLLVEDHHVAVIGAGVSTLLLFLELPLAQGVGVELEPRHRSGKRPLPVGRRALTGVVLEAVSGASWRAGSAGRAGDNFGPAAARRTSRRCLFLWGASGRARSTSAHHLLSRGVTSNLGLTHVASCTVGCGGFVHFRGPRWKFIV